MAIEEGRGGERAPPHARHVAVVVKTVLGSHCGVGEFTTHFGTYFSGDWGYDLDFDPWLCQSRESRRSPVLRTSQRSRERNHHFLDPPFPFFEPPPSKRNAQV